MSKRDHIRVHGIRRKRVDAAKLGRAVIELAQAQAEKEAQAEHEARQDGHPPDGTQQQDAGPGPTSQQRQQRQGRRGAGRRPGDREERP
jgi:hypothetical protein